jgi:hypothetical protein
MLNRLVLWGASVRRYPLALVLISTACTPAPLPVLGWSKPGATSDDYLKDRYQCILDARSQVGGAVSNAYGGAAAARQEISASVFMPCMSARGWSQDQNGFRPPPGGAVGYVR